MGWFRPFLSKYIAIDLCFAQVHKYGLTRKEIYCNTKNVLKEEYHIANVMIVSVTKIHMKLI